MEKEFSAALHPTQYGNHIKYGRHSERNINPEVQKLMEQGYNKRNAYRMVARAKADNKKDNDFDYDKETPKGEWV